MKLSEFDLSWYLGWPLNHRASDEFSRPGLTNFLGSVQSGGDPGSFRHVMFPPVSGAEESTGYLTINGRFLASTALKTKIGWCPWEIVRSCTYEKLEIRTRMCMVADAHAIVLKVEVSNGDCTERELSIAMRLSGRCVNRGKDPWFWGVPKVATSLDSLMDHGGLQPLTAAIEGVGRCSRERPIAGHPDAGQACTAQILSPQPDEWLSNGDAHYLRQLEPGQTFSFQLVFAMETDEAAIRLAKDVQSREEDVFEQAREAWQRLWQESFGPDKLPDLQMPKELIPVAASSVLNALQARRKFRVLGGKVRYNISTPRRVEACFYPNDWGLAGRLLAQLDAHNTWDQLAMALAGDIRRCNQVNLLTEKSGDASGRPWPYTIDVYNCFYVARELWLAEGGSAELLHSRILPTPTGEMSLLEVFEDLAFDWRKRRIAAIGLADYGPKEELLECVSSYAHVVAALNAGAAWMLFCLADIYRLLGREADALTDEAQSIVDAILQHLYVHGQGWFKCLDAHGLNPVEVRHCWDFGMVGCCIGDRLPPTVKNEMVHFFRNELQTVSWMRALSPQDADAAVSGIRVDHQFTGAFSAWPAQAGLALIRLGRSDLARQWLPGLARTARQGPFAQAHFDEDFLQPTHNGATKATDEFPHGCHWSNLGGGLFWAFVQALYDN